MKIVKQERTFYSWNEADVKQFMATQLKMQEGIEILPSEIKRIKLRSAYKVDGDSAFVNYAYSCTTPKEEVTESPPRPYDSVEKHRYSRLPRETDKEFADRMWAREKADRVARAKEVEAWRKETFNGKLTSY
jgi:hypothetical protein